MAMDLTEVSGCREYDAETTDLFAARYREAIAARVSIEKGVAVSPKQVKVEIAGREADCSYLVRSTVISLEKGISHTRTERLGSERIAQIAALPDLEGARALCELGGWIAVSGIVAWGAAEVAVVDGLVTAGGTAIEAGRDLASAVTRRHVIVFATNGTIGATITHAARKLNGQEFDPATVAGSFLFSGMVGLVAPAPVLRLSGAIRSGRYLAYANQMISRGVTIHGPTAAAWVPLYHALNPEETDPLTIPVEVGLAYGIGAAVGPSIETGFDALFSATAVVAQTSPSRIGFLKPAPATAGSGGSVPAINRVMTTGNGGVVSPSSTVRVLGTYIIYSEELLNAGSVGDQESLIWFAQVFIKPLTASAKNAMVAFAKGEKKLEDIPSHLAPWNGLRVMVEVITDAGGFGLRLPEIGVTYRPASEFHVPWQRFLNAYQASQPPTPPAWSQRPETYTFYAYSEPRATGGTQRWLVSHDGQQWIPVTTDGTRRSIVDVPELGPCLLRFDGNAQWLSLVNGTMEFPLTLEGLPRKLLNLKPPI